MTNGLRLEMYSIGVGDRFAQQAEAQSQACILAGQNGCMVVPVWSKSNREHLAVGLERFEPRKAADAAVRELGWTKPYYVDVGHFLTRAALSTDGRAISRFLSVILASSV